MKKGLLSIVSLLSITAGPLSATTSFFRTPLSFIESRWGTVHYPLPPLDNCGWQIDTMGVYYERNACGAFGCDPLCCPPCNTDSLCGNLNNTSTTRKTVPLAQLWFGKSSFTPADLGITNTGGNPFLAFTTLTPTFNYYERGVALAFNTYRMLGCDKSWFIGARAALPICTIEVNQVNSVEISSVNPDLANTIVTIQQQYHGTGPGTGSADTRTVKAYRLDFLSLLALPDGTPMVQYGVVNGDVSGNTRIAGQDITTNASQTIGGITAAHLRAPVYAYKQSSGVVPLPQQGLTVADYTSGMPQQVGQDLMIGSDANVLLNANGSGPADGQWAAFGGFDLPSKGTNDSQQNYAGGLAGNPAAQRQLFIVPVGVSSGGPTWEPIGLTVQDTIDYVVEQLQLTGAMAVDFFASKGFTLSDCATGAGDTFLDFYGGKWCDCWYADLLVGFRLPTGTDADNPKRLYQQTTGNNGHFGLKVGAEGGYQACEWLGIKGDVFWRHNFRATEKRAAAFVGATVRNIGPCVDAQVKWNDLQAHLDVTFFTPRCPNTGWDFGYEFYYRTKDDLCFCATQVYDLAGTLRTLDPNLAAAESRLLSHKVRGEIFNQWGCFEVFLGGSYIFAGDNVMKEREWHIGMKAYF
jgi:hypothetical protein